MAHPKIITVDEAGDVVLRFQDSKTQVDQQFRCLRRLLGQKSRYFDVLFNPNKFSEGKEVESTLNELSKSYNDVVSIPSACLPVVIIKEVGEIPATEHHRIVAIFIFLKILHDEAVEMMGYWRDPMGDFIILKQKPKTSSQQVLTRATMLVLLAERFDATEHIRHYFHESDELPLYFPRGPKSGSSSKYVEAFHRRQLLVGMFIGLHLSVLLASSALIYGGSVHWTRDLGSGDNPSGYRLPPGLEEELRCRREYILETISSLLSHFICLYCGKKQQCKLGYDTSPQCDSFQLGEMIRYLKQKNLLRLQNTFDLDQDRPICTDDIMKVIEKLRQCPSYQLDANHRHCGLRSRILPLLELLYTHGQAGICMRCWNGDQHKESWLTNPVGGTWSVSDRKVTPLAVDKECVRHAKLKAMYTAHERDWTSSRA